MSGHFSVPHLTESNRRLRDDLESKIIGLEGIIFASVTFIKNTESEETALKITAGTDNLAVAKPQLLLLFKWLGELEENFAAHVELVRGVGPKNSP